MKNLDNVQIHQSIDTHIADLNARLEQVTRAKDEAVKLAADRQHQLSQLTKAGYEQANLASERHRAGLPGTTTMNG